MNVSYFGGIFVVSHHVESFFKIIIIKTYSFRTVVDLDCW